MYVMSASTNSAVTLISIFDKAGSRGNSTIFLPRAVSSPVLPKAPRIHSCNSRFGKYLRNINVCMRAFVCVCYVCIDYV